jgi:hypothetical protein
LTVRGLRRKGTVTADRLVRDTTMTRVGTGTVTVDRLVRNTTIKRVGTGIVMVDKPVTGTVLKGMGTTKGTWRDMEDSLATADRATRRAGLQDMDTAMAEERAL